MASVGSKIRILLAVWILPEIVHTFAKLECNKTSVGEYGHQSLLMCVVKSDQNEKNIKVIAMSWKKDGKSLYFFYKGETNSLPRYELAETSWNEYNTNVSLLISNTNISDAGSYLCEVVTDKGDVELQISLRVRAKYSTPVIERKSEKGDKSLVCTSHGYPRGEMRWFSDNDEWTKSAQLNVKEMDNGLFQLYSKLPLLPGSTLPKYWCAVFNESGIKEVENFYEDPEKQEDVPGAEKIQSTKYVVPIVVIGSLIVGLLLALLICRRRSQNQWDEVRREPDIEAGDADELQLKI